MKTTKKVLGVVLALAMMLNVFAVVSFAAVPADTAAALYISADKASYKAGDVVTFTVSEEVIDAVGDMRIGGQYAIHYDASVFAPLAQTAAPSDLNIAAIAPGYDESISGVVFTDDNIGLGHILDDGFDGLVKLVICDDGATTFSATSKTDLFTFQMKVLDTAADGNYTVGFNVGSIESYDVYINDNINGGMYGSDGSAYGVTNMFNYGSCSVKIGEDSKIIKAVKDNDGNVLSYVGWGNYDETKDTCDGDMTTGKLNFAIRGTFDAADIAPVAGKISFDETNKRTVQEIEALSASAKIGGVEKGPCSTQFIYGAENGEGSYEYFVVIEGVNYADITDGTLTVEITFGGTLTAGGPISGETVTVNLKDAYDAAVARSLPAYSAS